MPGYPGFAYIITYRDAVVYTFANNYCKIFDSAMFAVGQNIIQYSQQSSCKK